MDLNPPAFGGWRTCNDTMCSRTPTLNSPQEWLAACFTVFNPLIRAPIILCQPEAIGAETVSLGKWLFSRKQKLTQCLQALPSKPSLSQPSLPVRKTELPNLTALIACKSQSLAALSPTCVIHILYIGTYFNIEYVTWGEMQPLSLMLLLWGGCEGRGGGGSDWACCQRHVGCWGEEPGCLMAQDSVRENNMGLVRVTEMGKPRVSGGSGSASLPASGSLQDLILGIKLLPGLKLSNSWGKAVSCGSRLAESWQSHLGAHSPAQRQVSEITAI